MQLEGQILVKKYVLQEANHNQIHFNWLENILGYGCILC